MPVSATQPVYPPAAGKPIEAGWGDSVSESVMQRFSSAADRDAKWISPPDGALAYHDDQPWLRVGGAWGGFAPVPAGSVFSTIAVVAPIGYLLLDGSTVVGGQTLYPKLWLVIPAAWKSGVNIVLPDARGRTIVGAGAGGGLTNRPIGSVFGEENHVLSVAELAAHAHNGATGGNTSNHNHTMAHTHGYSVALLDAGPFDNQVVGRHGGNPTGTWNDTTHGASDTVTSLESGAHLHGIAANGSSAGHNNMPPALALSLIIKN